jgi:Ca2+-binding EF-hand superfamily protein
VFKDNSRRHSWFDSAPDNAHPQALSLTLRHYKESSMKAKMIACSTTVVVLCLMLLLPAAAREPDSQANPPRTNRGGDHGRPGNEERWQRLDQDSDGKISRFEWKRDKQTFDRMDADKDGFLTKDELRSAAREFRGRHRNRLREMDSDADGSISRSEWKGKEETFNRLDANGDGLLSGDELQGARKRHGPGSSSRDQSERDTL